MPSPRPPISRRQQEEQRQRALIVKVLRATFVVLLTVVTSVAIVRGSALSGQVMIGWGWLAASALSYFALIVGVDLLTAERKLSTISAILFGCFAGLLATVMVSFFIDYFVEILDIGATEGIVLTVKILAGLGLCYIGITTVLQTQDDFRLVIPYVEFAKQYRGTKPLLLDTSALVDGRIGQVAEVGFFQAPFVVPRFVIDELQALSDSRDALKRARGRRGLELLSRMQRSALLDVSIDDTFVPGAGVDQMLVELARTMPAVIVTTDLGLNRVAAIHGVPVLNLNDLSNALKTSVVPGETLRVDVIKPGEQPGQGVGYLEDGTMIVIERGGPAVGSATEVVVTSSMQTSAGRLIFARLASEGAQAGAAAAPAEAESAPEAGVEEGPEGGGEAEMSEGPSMGEASHHAGPFGPQKRKRAGTPRNPRRL